MSRRKPRLRRTARAEEDLIDIWTYIARDNPSAADRLLDLLDEKSRSLARNPRLGAAREDVAPGVRHLPVGRYLILYRDLGDGVEVVRYIHGMRRLQDLF
ncbi:MAG TPA: type II toxin-antitoxin system RelE/ParE family toxin [Rhodoplanes sp.]|nr:type II toxin-antitoxin system RelE/ParE family toxin [Rhodoplanes sp.]